MNETDTQNKTKVSIIIPCYNEEKHLPDLFSSLANLDTAHADFEVILVDNGSTDDSYEIAKKAEGIKVLSKKEGNIGSLRNFGSKHGNGKIYAFLDADCLPMNDWLTEGCKYLNNDEIGLFGSIPICPQNGTWVEKAWHGKTPSGARNTEFICTANMMIKADAFNRVGGFDEVIETGEDYDICQRILAEGFRVIHDSDIKVIHLRYPKTLWQRLKKEIWYGKEMFAILKVKPFYRPFWTSLIFGIALILFPLLFIVPGLRSLSYLCLLLVLTLPLASAFFKCKQGRKYKYLPQITVLFFAYLSGRFVSIITAIPTLFKSG